MPASAHRQARRGCGWLVLGCLLALISAPGQAHDWYSGMKSGAKGVEGYSCCSGDSAEAPGDCRPVSAWMVGDRWRVRDGGREYDVPDDAIHPDEENREPFQASACIWQGRVICFWRKRAGG